MGTQYTCKSPRRAQAIRDYNAANAGSPVQGVDYLEVFDSDDPDWQAYRQRLLFIFCFAPVDGEQVLSVANVTISGGVRVRSIQVVWARPASELMGESPSEGPEGAAYSYLASLNLDGPELASVLVVYTDVYGDFSTYGLTLRKTGETPRLDPVLSSVEFSFKVACPSEFDCATATPVTSSTVSEPRIDYLARDYSGVRRLMLDRLATVLPGWTERSPADVGVVVIETLAWASDQLSYYQDAVATEAYLETARKRVSVRRHARLLDYHLHDGCNARAFVAIEVSDDLTSPLTLPGPSGTAPGTRFLTRTSDMPPVIAEDDVAAALAAGGEVFEALHDVTLHKGNKELEFYTWSDTRCCLPAGTTSATVVTEEGTQLKAGDLLLLEEVLSPRTGSAAEADLSHRHVVRLTAVDATSDPLLPEAALLDLQWHAEDALPFALCVSRASDLLSTAPDAPVSVARGNIVLVDHGRTLAAEPLDPVTSSRYRPMLQNGPVTQQGRVLDALGESLLFDPDAPAARVFQWEMAQVRPALWLEDPARNETWTVRRDLLSSDSFTTAFVLETEDDGSAMLRFGDDIFGKSPAEGTMLTAYYRVGNGTAGNVGADAIAHLLTSEDAPVDSGSITRIRNPLPARGGVDPESIDEVRLLAPRAFRTQKRAVTEEDYATVARAFPGVQRAVATSRFTGAWSTIFVAVDRLGGAPVDSAFKAALTTWLERYRTLRHDIKVEGPRYVPLDVAFTVHLKDGQLRGDLKQTLLALLGSDVISDGQRGFFHPDNFSFGDPVFLSRIVQTVMSVSGVAWVDTSSGDGKPHRFQRFGQGDRGELERGVIDIGRVEIARLDNDPSQPEYGRLEIYLEGGI